MSAFPKHPKAPYAHPTTLNAEYQFAAYPLITNLPDTDRLLIEVPDGSRQWIDNASKYFTIEESDGTEETEESDEIHYAIKEGLPGLDYLQVYRHIRTEGDKMLLEKKDGGRFWIAADNMVRGCDARDESEPLPDWAEKRSDGKYMEIGAQLPTRDGRRCGNAVVTFVEQEREGPHRVATVITDAGNKMTLTKNEAAEMFYHPELIMKSEGIFERVRLNEEKAEVPMMERLVCVESGEAISFRPYGLSRLFAEGQTFIEDSKEYVVVSCEILDGVVLTRVNEKHPTPPPAINIILDESDPTSPRFVEIEDDEGKSIDIGKRIKYGRYTKLRITPEGITNA